KAAKKKRMLTYGALGVSMLMSVAMLFAPGSSPPPSKPVVTETLPTSGRLQHIDAKRSNFFLEGAGGQSLPGITYNPQIDRILLEDKKVGLEDLQPGDEIEIKRYTGQNNQQVLEILATRSVGTYDGKIDAIDVAQGRMTLGPASGSGD